MEDVSTIIKRFYYWFGYSRQEKGEDVSAIIILVLSLWVLKSRESGGRLQYYHSFSNSLGTGVKRKWRTSQLLSYLLYCFGYSNHEKVEDVSNIIILFSNALGTQVKRK